jgi:5-methylcytosine-specific restriction endonuclease McrA
MSSQTKRQRSRRIAKIVTERDGLVCRQCGRDVHKLRVWLCDLPKGPSMRHGTGKSYKRWRSGNFGIWLGRHRRRAETLLGWLWGISLNSRSLGEVDHVVPLDEGGEDSVDNCLFLCLRCHKQKTTEQAARRARRPTKGIGL